MAEQLGNRGNLERLRPQIGSEQHQTGPAPPPRLGRIEERLVTPFPGVEQQRRWIEIKQSRWLSRNANQRIGHH